MNADVQSPAVRGASSLCLGADSRGRLRRPKHVPVVGTATVDGKPLAGFVVSFNPDPDKGHTARLACAGRVGGDGRYSLISDDGFKVTKGALLG